MNPLSTIIRPRQLDTFPTRAIKNVKNDGHCTEVTTRGGKQNIDPPMPSEVEIMVKKDDDETEVNGESKNATEKEAKISW